MVLVLETQALIDEYQKDDVLDEDEVTEYPQNFFVKISKHLLELHAQTDPNADPVKWKLFQHGLEDYIQTALSTHKSIHVN